MNSIFKVVYVQYKLRLLSPTDTILSHTSIYDFKNEDAKLNFINNGIMEDYTEIDSDPTICTIVAKYEDNYLNINVTTLDRFDVVFHRVPVENEPVTEVTFIVNGNTYTGYDTYVRYSNKEFMLAKANDHTEDQMVYRDVFHMYAHMQQATFTEMTNVSVNFANAVSDANERVRKEIGKQFLRLTGRNPEYPFIMYPHTIIASYGNGSVLYNWVYEIKTRDNISHYFGFMYDEYIGHILNAIEKTPMIYHGTDISRFYENIPLQDREYNYPCSPENIEFEESFKANEFIQICKDHGMKIVQVIYSNGELQTNIQLPWRNTNPI